MSYFFKKAKNLGEKTYHEQMVKKPTKWQPTKKEYTETGKMFWPYENK